MEWGTSDIPMKDLAQIRNKLAERASRSRPPGAALPGLAERNPSGIPVAEVFTKRGAWQYQERGETGNNIR